MSAPNSEEHEEPEITPEMIAAGVEVYYAHARALANAVAGEPEEFVEEVFREMFSRLRPARQGP